MSLRQTTPQLNPSQEAFTGVRRIFAYHPTSVASLALATCAQFGTGVPLKRGGLFGRALSA